MKLKGKCMRKETDCLPFSKLHPEANQLLQINHIKSKHDQVLNSCDVTVSVLSIC